MVKTFGNGWVLTILPLIPQIDTVKQACAIFMEALIHEIQINEDISFPSPHVIVILLWLHGKPLGKRRTTIIRKRVVVFRNHEQCISGPVPWVLWGPLCYCLGGCSYRTRSHWVIVSEAGMGKVPGYPDEDFSKRKMRLVITREAMISFSLQVILVVE